MAQGKSTGNVFGQFIHCIILHGKSVEAKEWEVGDAAAWNNTRSWWPKYKDFSAGNVLVFKYNIMMHTVVQTDKTGYDTCDAGRPGATTHNSGNDRIELAAGDNYFICGHEGHCLNTEQKIRVTAK